ncbi:type VII secretion protein EccCa [Jatrophihabitans sp. YIM 134969]
MAVTLRRGPRLTPPEVPTGRIVMQPPPEIKPSEGSSGLLMNLLPALGSIGSIVFVAASSPGPKGYLAAGMFLIASLGFVGVNGWRQSQQHKAEVLESRREYLAYLAEVRDTIREAADRQRRNLTWTHPDPSNLAALAEERTRVWERATDDADHLTVRVGRAAQPLCITLEPPETPPMVQLDPVAASALHRLLSTHRMQPDLPVGIDIREHSRIEVTGDQEEPVRALARAMVLEAATMHGPDQLLVAVVAAPSALPAWEWAKWLPHTQSDRETDGVGPARMIAPSVGDLEPLLPEDLRDRPRFGPRGSYTGPHVLVVVDGGEVPSGNTVVTEDGVLGITVLELPERWAELEGTGRMRLALGDALRTGPAAGQPALEVLRPDQPRIPGAADQVSVAQAEATARRLAPLTIGGGGGPSRSDPLAESNDLFDLLGLGDVRDYDPDQAWRPRLNRDRLRVPIGLGAGGQVVSLDIKESAQQGMGPHGLIIGATGSGKSEVLRTLVLALATTHSSEQLNFVLVDFKGGATFAGMADMPHVSAVITNLADELTLVDRMQDALHGEMVRRQELLRASGNFANVTDYEKARADGRTDLAPLPALLIVADEFSELLAAKPEFVDLFVAIGRLGRSLSMHLLLASQRLEEGKLRGLDSHLSYRIGLRTFSAAESRTVLGVPDAYELPPVPGLGYLKPDQTTLEQFKAAYVSGPPPRRRRAPSSVGGTSGGGGGIVPFRAAPVLTRRMAEPDPVDVEPVDDAEPEDKRAQFDIAVSAMRGKGPAAHQVWLPPLDVPDTLDQLMPDLAEDPRLGLVSHRWRGTDGISFPLGIVDRPLEQRRDLMWVNLGGAAGHMAIVGAPRTGKSTLARTVVSAISLTRTPLETQFFVLDFGGGTFSPMAKLAHVAGVASRSEPDVVRRVVAEIEGIVNNRETFFRRHGIDSIETYRRRRFELLADGSVLDDGYGDLFLVIDGWSTIRAEFDTLEPRLQDLAGRGLTFGLHFIVAAARWMDFRTQIKDALGTRIELRLGDHTDSEIDRKVAANVPKERPGRGIVASRHHFLAGLPRIDADQDAGTLGSGVDDLISRISTAWKGPNPPKLRLLPDRIDLDTVRAQAGADDRRVLLGIDEATLGPVGQDMAADPHLYLFGDSGSGKSALLRGAAHEIMRLNTPKQAQIFAVDYRRALLGEIPEEYLAGYLTTHDQATEELGGLAQYLRGRLPGPDVTAEQLRNRSWWSGAEVYVLVDDYDLVATSMGNPVTALQPLLAQAGDVGLHLVLTRRSGGASRALFDPVIQALRDLAAPGILLSGSPDEGQLIGNVKPSLAVPGRGQLISRAHGLQVVQLAWCPSAS